MSHYGKVIDAEREALDKLDRWARMAHDAPSEDFIRAGRELREAAYTLADERAASCPTCGGTMWARIADHPGGDKRWVPCTAGCDNGRVRT